jgi:hypothetical protein
MATMPRRDFLKTAAATAAALAFAPRRLFAEAGASAARVVVAHGTDIPRMLAAGIAALGGWGAFVRPGQKATLKPNAGWASTPEQGANTHPQLVEEAIRAIRVAGASEVVLPENPCSPAARSFAMSGIGAAAKNAGGRLYEPDDDKDFVEVAVPGGKTLKQVAVVRDVLETGCPDQRARGQKPRRREADAGLKTGWVPSATAVSGTATACTSALPISPPWSKPA